MKDGALTAYIAATRSGKSVLAKKRLVENFDELRRALVWSPYEHRDNYASVIRHSDLICGAPGQLLKACSDIEFSAVYVPDRRDDELLQQQFAFFCGLALSLGECVVLVEELSLVASSRKCPVRWRELVTGGLGNGLTVMATTQQPQLCDTSMLDNATEIYCGRLNRGSSHKIMADAMGGLPLDQVRGLQPLQFLHWRAGADQVEPVTVEIPGKKRRRQKQGVRT